MSGPSEPLGLLPGRDYCRRPSMSPPYSSVNDRRHGLCTFALLVVAVCGWIIGYTGREDAALLPRASHEVAVESSQTLTEVHDAKFYCALAKRLLRKEHSIPLGVGASRRIDRSGATEYERTLTTQPGDGSLYSQRHSPSLDMSTPPTPRPCATGT